MGLLDSILGAFNSGQGGFIPGDMPGNAPGSGTLPPDQVSTPPADSYGNSAGGPAPGGGLAAALGLNPDTMRRVSAGLAGGLSNVKSSPFPWQAAANAAGGAFAGENKSDDTNTTQTLQAIDRALKLQQIKQLGSYRDDMSDTKFGQLGINQQKADQAGTYQNGRRAIGQLNRPALGPNADGTPLPKAKPQTSLPGGGSMMAQALPDAAPDVTVKPPAAPGSDISMPGDGTRATPYQPKTMSDFADVTPGSHFIDPGDGKLYVKK
jgi:hypothetical protein